MAQGNFGPPHRGHFELVQRALRDLPCDILIIYCENGDTLFPDRYTRACRHPFPLHTSFTIWLEFAELLYCEFPNINIMFCDSKYRSLLLDDSHAYPPAHFGSWQQRASFGWIRGIDSGNNDKDNPLYKTVLSYNEISGKPCVAERSFDGTDGTAYTTLGQVVTDVYQVYMYARQSTYSATSLTERFLRGEDIDSFWPVLLSPIAREVCYNALVNGCNKHSKYELQNAYIKEWNQSNTIPRVELQGPLECGLVEITKVLPFFAYMVLDCRKISMEQVEKRVHRCRTLLRAVGNHSISANLCADLNAFCDKVTQLIEKKDKRALDDFIQMQHERVKPYYVEGDTQENIPEPMPDVLYGKQKAWKIAQTFQRHYIDE